MKKNLIFYLLASICIGCFYQCANEDSDFSTEVSLEQLAQDFNIGQQSTKAIFEQGKIEMGMDGNMLIIGLIKNEQDQEHLAFRVQVDESITEKQTIEKGTILFVDNQLLIENATTKESYFISLLNTAPHSDLATRTYTKTIAAVGIGQFTLEMDASKIFPFPISGGNNGSCQCYPSYQNPFGNYSSSGFFGPEAQLYFCSSGGLGSTTCSTCCCQITCSVGFYACCDEY